MSRIYRLLHIIDHLGSGGAQEALLSLVKYFDRRRFRVEVATLHGQGHYWESFGRLAVPVYSLSPRKYIPVYLPKLFLLLRAGKFDLIHCHLTASNLIAKPLAAILGVPLIFNYDQNDMYRTQQKTRLWLDRLANRLTDHIIAVSASTRDFLIQQEGVPADKITLIYNGVDLDRFHPAPDASTRASWRHAWGLPENTPVVAGWAACVSKRTSPLFLRVAREVLREIPQAGFVIAGEGPDRPNLEPWPGTWVSPHRSIFWATSVI